MASQASSDAPDTSDLAGTDEDSLEQSHTARMGLSSPTDDVINDSSMSGSNSDGSSSQAALLRGSGFSVGSSGASSLPSAGLIPPPAPTVASEEDDSQGRELLPVTTSDPESTAFSISNRKMRSQGLRRLARTMAPTGPKGLSGGQGSSDLLHARNAGGQYQQPLMYLFSGHDSTITPLLASEFAREALWSVLFV